MTLLWTAADMAAATDGEIAGDWEGVTGLSIDTRSIRPGEMFIALKGDNRDGHTFLRQAFEAGAGAALVSDWPEDLGSDARLLVVEDTMAALQALGRAGRNRCDARVVAVTGSVGKTSTKEMLRAMLAGQGRSHAPEKSFNNHWGVPLTLARMPADTEYAVIEIGMNHPGEITPLSRMTRPHVALITTVEAVHLAQFDSVEQIADAKAEIFAGLEPGGAAVLNADNAYFERLAAQTDAKIVSFGKRAELRLTGVELADSATIMRAEIHGQEIFAKIGAPGKHLAMNALGALGAVEALGADIARAALALARWTPPDGRGRRECLLIGPGGIDGEITLLDESYNANPASVRAALAVLGVANPINGTGRVEKGRRVAILGDMLELGPAEAQMHGALASAGEMTRVDLVHTCGPLMQSLHKVLPRAKRGRHAADSRELAEMIPHILDAGDVVMVKGSLGSAMARVVDAIRRLGKAQEAED